MVCRNEEFKLLHNNFVHRSKNPLKKMQSLIALCGKLIKILFAMVIKGVAYDPTQVICHLTNLQTEQNAA
ncbi:hypothetical protein [Clostridium simiarum]|nr:hypothetical protein [Clostridium simiarum]